MSDAPHLKYAYEILEGDIAVNPLTLKACERAIREHQDPQFDRGDWVYDYRYAEAFFKFASFVPHIKGAKIGQTFYFEPWQKFLIGEILGWRDRENKKRMRFTQGLLEIPKKNGKTSIAALFALYELLYGEKGGEIFSLATKKDQAKIVWKMVEKMVHVLRHEWQKKLNITTNLITSERAEFAPLAKDSGSLDGPSPHRLLIDEAAAILNRDLIEKMVTAMAERLSPFSLYTTTPQSDTNTTYYETREQLRLGLEGKLSSAYIERMFGVIYAMEEEDDIYDEDIWLKANPNLGVSVRVDYLQQRLDEIVTSPSKATNIRMLNFGFWEKSTSKWINTLDWDSCAGDVIRGGSCYLGADLALRKDLAVVARIWVLGKDRYHVDFQCFTTERHYESVSKQYKEIYRQARDSGILKVMPGKVIDMYEVEAYIRKTFEEYGVLRMGFDPYNANDMVSRLENEAFPVMIVPQNITKLNNPTQMLEASVTGGQLVHDGNPFIRWQVENCFVYQNINNLIKVRASETDDSKKVDAVSALITGFACVDMGQAIEESNEIVVLSM